MYTKNCHLYVINKTVTQDHAFCEDCVKKQQELVKAEVGQKVWLTNIIPIEPGCKC